MEKMQIFIKDKKIPLIIRNYKTSKSIKAYYKGDVLYISKPTRVPLREINKFIQNYEKFLYDEYIKIKSNKNLGIKKWINGEKIYYKGKQFTILTNTNRENELKIKVNERNKIFYINMPATIHNELRQELILKEIKKFFKKNTEIMIKEKLEYWSEVTGIEYKTYKVHDATTRYGSCIKAKKSLNFSSRIIMLPSKIVDAIVVHELCHIEQANHSQKFYDLVEKYIPDYKKADKWLKENNNLLNL